MTNNMRQQKTEALKGKVFIPRYPGMPGGFVYVREAKGGMVSFSVKEHYTEEPVFDDCGVFTISVKDFKRVYKPFAK